MGACSGAGEFVSIDWKRGIREVQAADEDYYGDQDGYSGASNSCNFRYKGDYSKLSKSEINKWIDDRLEHLSTGDGEVICIGIDSYAIYSTEIKEISYVPFDTRYVLKNMGIGPAAIVEMKANTPYVVKKGTVAELKKEVHTLLRACDYEKKYYIVGKTKTYICGGSYKTQKKTQRKTDKNHLVIPMYRFVYYGWFRE